MLINNFIHIFLIVDKYYFLFFKYLTVVNSYYLLSQKILDCIKLYKYKKKAQLISWALKLMFIVLLVTFSNE